jgi:hypothetical protein
MRLLIVEEINIESLGIELALMLPAASPGGVKLQFSTAIRKLHATLKN